MRLNNFPVFLRDFCRYGISIPFLLAVYSGSVGAKPDSLDLPSQDIAGDSTRKSANLRAPSVGSLNVVGPDSNPAIRIEPGREIQRVVDFYPAGTTFLLKKGIHRLQRIIPKTGNTFLGEKGTILSGARVLTEFNKEGKYWVVTGQTQKGQVHGQCQMLPNGHRPSSCQYPEDLFRDDVPYNQVTKLSELKPNKWFFDYDQNRIYLSDNPAGHNIETSITRYAFEGESSNVAIRGLIIEKYANPAQHGAIHGNNGEHWTIADSEIRLNHGVGIRTGEHMRILNSHIHHNGQLGIGGSGDNILIQKNEISYNNTYGFSRDWEAGGAKFVKTRNLIVRDNIVHHNWGPGLWTDIDNMSTLYEGNQVEDNERAGIFHEISYAAIIRDNAVERNGLGFPVWLWGAGILIAGSTDTEVYGNIVIDNADGIGAIQQKRGVGLYGPHIVKNLYVHDNVVSTTQGNTGLVQDIGDSTCFTHRNNRFEDNTYYLLGNQKKYFVWMNTYQTEQAWQSYGQDLRGKFFWDNKQAVKS